MPRSRETIQADIDALQAELAVAQPDTLQLISRYNKTFKVSVWDLDLSVEGGGTGWLFKATDAELLRDWLNYRFPKTEETA